MRAWGVILLVTTSACLGEGTPMSASDGSKRGDGTIATKRPLDVAARGLGSPAEEPAAQGIEQRIAMLGRDDVPLARKREIKREVVALGKPAFPILIAHLEDDAVFEKGRDVQNYYGLPPHLPMPKPILADITVGSECRDMLYDLLLPAYASPYARNIKPLSFSIFEVRDWKAWWDRNREKTLDEIHEEMKPLVDRYWREGGAVQIVP